MKDADGAYEDTVRALLEVGARVGAHEPLPEHAGVREVLRSFSPDAAR